MSNVTLKRIEDIECSQEHRACDGIRVRPAGEAIGVAAWGMNVLELESGINYPDVEHVANDNEEVYVVLRGSATLEANKEAHLLGAGALVRIGAGVHRKLLPGPAGVTLLTLAATPQTTSR